MTPAKAFCAGVLVTLAVLFGSSCAVTKENGESAVSTYYMRDGVRCYLFNGQGISCVVVP